VAKEPLPDENLRLVPEWAAKEGFSDNEQAVAGADIFAQVGCMNCHTYRGAGATNLNAPDLSDIGRTSNRGVAEFSDYVADPTKFGNTVMPKFGGDEGLGDENLTRIGEFLQASK
jgi:mono/diheme cytochrome c family protein